MRTPLRAVAAAQFGAFTAAQALTCYTRGEIRARLRSQRWHPVHRGIFCLSDAEAGARLRWAAACMALGRCVPACLHTAAELHGFGVLDDTATHVAVAPDSACRHRRDLWPHQLALTDHDLTRLRCGALVTTADRTAIDLARTVSRLDVLPVIDAALEAGVCTPESLAVELTRHAGLRGIRQAAELVPMGCRSAESPQESRMRLHCHDAGLPRPVVQLAVHDSVGRERRWLDLGWERARVGLEYDGVESHPEDRRHADRQRHNLLQGLDWLVFYATDADIHGDPRLLMGQVGEAIARRSV